MQAYVIGERVLANCGTRKQPDWIPGLVIDRQISQYQPVMVRLDEESDGETEWNFPDSYLIADNKRNRKRKGLPPLDTSKRKSG